jgi:hypothetical protein
MPKRVDTRPVKRFRWPAYPTKLEVLTTPELLKKHQPPAWLSNRELAAAAGVFLAANAAGCGKSATDASNGARLAPDAPAIVAPIFEHGDGRGVTGCVVLNPPCFLSEEEARQIMKDELARYGIQTSQEDVAFDGVVVPRRHIRIAFDRKNRTVSETIVVAPGEEAALSVDLVDSTHQIAVEYVSISDYGSLGGPVYEPGTLSSAHHYDFAETAQFAGRHIKGKPAGAYFGVFYDPLAHVGQFVKWTGKQQQGPLPWMWDTDERRQMADAESKRLLRQQVKDFVDWLKAQGVI